MTFWTKFVKTRIKETILVFRVVPPITKRDNSFASKLVNLPIILILKRNLVGWYRIQTKNIRQILCCCFVTCVCFFVWLRATKYVEKKRMNPPVSPSIINANLFRGHQHWQSWGCLFLKWFPLVPLLQSVIHPKVARGAARLGSYPLYYHVNRIERKKTFENASSNGLSIF